MDTCMKPDISCDIFKFFTCPHTNIRDYYTKDIKCTLLITNSADLSSEASVINFSCRTRTEIKMSPKGRVSAHLRFQSLWKLLEEEKEQENQQGAKKKSGKTPLKLSNYEKYQAAKEKQEKKEKKRFEAKVKKMKKEGKQPDIRMMMGVYLK